MRMAGGKSSADGSVLVIEAEYELGTMSPFEVRTFRDCYRRCRIPCI